MTNTVLEGVRGGDSEFPVSICHDEDSDRLVVRAINEGGFSCTDVDLLDFLTYLATRVPGSVDVDAIAASFAAGDDHLRRS